MHRLRAIALLCVAAAALGAKCPRGSFEPSGQLSFASPQSEPIALSRDGSALYVANTAAGTLDVIDTKRRKVVARVPVGVEPVSVAVRPGGGQVWVANHVSDSLSVVDVDRKSKTYLHVIETVQSVDAESLVTRFDEPVGVAFASEDKAYVTLSSRNQIAVVDARSYQVSKLVPVASQEPRALAVRNGRLYVAALESGNQTELSTCPQFPGTPFPLDGDQCTFDLTTQINFAGNPNMVGVPVDLVRDPKVPDRDLYVYDTTDESLVDVVSGVGTLLYGLAVSSEGRVFVSLTEARNDANGRAGTQGQGLADLANRMFLNRIVALDCGGAECAAPEPIELEPAPPDQPAPGEQLATPFGLALSADDRTLVGTAAASSRVFTLDVASGAVLGRIDVGAIPRGVALASDPRTGAPRTAYVLSTLGASVSVLDVSDPRAIEELARIALADPTPARVRDGHIAFENANASTTGTFACASCHPDGNTDQLLWIIGAVCSFEGCDQEEPRSTMPVRGLRGTLPLHWDGTLGDPIGGTNGEVLTNPFGIAGSGVPQGIEVVPPTCTDDASCFRHVVDASLAGVMCDPAACPANAGGLAGGLSAAERDAMALFLQNVPYPPPRSRRPDDQLSAAAVAGFEDFFFNQGGINPPGPDGLGPETCADATGGCHALPFGTSSNSVFVGGFDAPTMRGITDRWLQFSAGVTHVFEQLIFSPFVSDVPWNPRVGPDELSNWALAFGTEANPGAFRGVYNVGPFDIFQMVEEASTGFSGALGRQLTLNARTLGTDELTRTLDALERADALGLVNLVLRGSNQHGPKQLVLSFEGGVYRDGKQELTRAELLALARERGLVATLTAALPEAASPDHPQPELWVDSVGGALAAGALDLPELPGDNPMLLFQRFVAEGSSLLVDGAPAAGAIECMNGAFEAGVCSGDQVRVTLAALPAPGTHLLQIATPHGLASNELPFSVR